MMKSYPCTILQNATVPLLFCLAFVAGGVFVISDLHGDSVGAMEHYRIACRVSLMVKCSGYM